MAEDLVEKLDGLLERYLSLLDQYQQAREQLSKDLSSGYLSLARANAASAGRAHYGQDYYDERMQASRRIHLTDAETGPKSLKVEVVEVEDVAASPDSDNNDKPNVSAAKAGSNSGTQRQKQKQKSKQVGGMTIGTSEESDHENELEKAFIALQLNKGAAKPSGPQDQPRSESAAKETDERPKSKTSNKHDKETDKRNHHNAIQMFGFFVPTTLRQAQASFVEAVVTIVPTLVELDSEMSLLEIEIRRTRKAVGKGN